MRKLKTDITYFNPCTQRWKTNLVTKHLEVV